MKRLFRLLLALMVSASMVFVAVSCSEGGSSSGSKKDDDEDEDIYEEAVWTEFDDVEFIKLLESYDGCDKVKYEEGWDDSEDLDEEYDVSKDATACTYRIKTEDGDIYLFMELEDDELTAKGMIDIDGDECDEDDAADFLEELADNYTEEPASGANVEDVVVSENNTATEVEVVPDTEPDASSYGEKAYGRFYFGMSMDEAEYVIDGEYDIEDNCITICDWDDEYYDEDYNITGYVNCDYMSLYFSDYGLYRMYVSTDDISDSQAENVIDNLISYYGNDYTYDSSYGSYSWSDSGIYASLNEYSDYSEVGISFSNYDYYD